MKQQPQLLDSPLVPHTNKSIHDPSSSEKALLPGVAPEVLGLTAKDTKDMDTRNVRLEQSNKQKKKALWSREGSQRDGLTFYSDIQGHL